MSHPTLQLNDSSFNTKNQSGNSKALDSLSATLWDTGENSHVFSSWLVISKISMFRFFSILAAKLRTIIASLRENSGIPETPFCSHSGKISYNIIPRFS